MLQITNVSPYTNLVGAKEKSKKAHATMVFIHGGTVYPLYCEIDEAEGGTGRSRSDDDHWEPPTSWRSLSDD